MWSRAVFLAALAVAPSAAADTAVRAGPARDVVVTIYRDNLALITEIRDVTLSAQGGRIEFPGVLEGALAESAVLRGLEGRERERNFDFDGLSAHSLLAKSVGRQALVVRSHKRTDRTAEEPAVIAAAGNGVALQFKDRLEALGCSGFPEKLVLSQIPDGLKERPTLSTTLAPGDAGPRTVTLSYLALGLGWKADYVVTERSPGQPYQIDAWVTLTNEGAEGFRDAQVGVVAGELNRVLSQPTRAFLRQAASRACWASGTTSDVPLRDNRRFRIPPPPPPPPPPMAMAAPMMAREAMADEIIATGSRVEREELGDYQFYRMAEPTTLNPRQTKQVRFLSKTAAVAARVYRGDINAALRSDQALSTSVLLRFRNDEAQGLGEPLPKGSARVFAPFRGRTLYVGRDDDLRDTARGLEWEIKSAASEAVSLQAKTVTARTVAMANDRERQIATREVRVTNASAQPATLELVERVYGDSQRINGETVRNRMKDGQPTWTLTLPPGGEQTLRYTISWIR
jgi:hypothetical protein